MHLHKQSWYVVANGGTSCDVDGWIWSTLSRYCGCIVLKYAVRWLGQKSVQFVVMRAVAANSVCVEVIS